MPTDRSTRALRCSCSDERHSGAHPKAGYRSASRRRALGGLLLACLSSATLRPAQATSVKLPPPGPRDTCPICGMFVAPYPYWVATVAWRDGKAVHFDGAKDLFKYLADLPRYAPGRAATEIVAIGVTDYYNTQRIDARSAWYVIGSDVLGPMGHELVPHDSEADAKEFVSDHKGRRILRFGDVAPGLLADLDAGRFR